MLAAHEYPLLETDLHKALSGASGLRHAKVGKAFQSLVEPVLILNLGLHLHPTFCHACTSALQTCRCPMESPQACVSASLGGMTRPSIFMSREPLGPRKKLHQQLLNRLLAVTLPQHRWLLLHGASMRVCLTEQ